MGTKPILFSAEMVRAIIEGRKTQTRRVIKRKYTNTDLEIKDDKYGRRLIEKQNDVPKPKLNPDGTTTHYLTSFAEVNSNHNIGDILWVRETFCGIIQKDDSIKYHYKASVSDVFKDAVRLYWKPSIHMPKKAARLFLKVVDVRYERLKDISLEGAIAEGIPITTFKGDVLQPISAFYSYWMDLYGYKSWEANPWVWVYEFEKIEKPENFLNN